VEQLRGPFVKFVDSPYLRKRPSPHLHKVPTLCGKVLKGSDHFGGRHRWEYNIDMDLRGIEFEVLDWIVHSQVWDPVTGFCDYSNEQSVSIKANNFLASCLILNPMNLRVP
jgi:hypothetical protein